MAKAAVKEVAVTSAAGLPAELAAKLRADAGLGYENVTQDDKIIPFVTIAQALSPQVNERDSAYIKGLKQGDFFNVATGRVWSGQDGFKFVPVLYERKYLEWVPREKGGGFAGEHGPEVMEKVASEERGGKFANWLPNGNTIAVTGTWYGIIIDPDTGHAEQAVLAMASTQLKKSKALNSKLDTVRAEVDGEKFKPAMFYNVVDVKSTAESNDKGNWFGWGLSLDGSVFALPGGGELYAVGKDFLEAVRSGSVKVDASKTGIVEGEVIEGDKL